jgi:hypothetical protein
MKRDWLSTERGRDRMHWGLVLAALAAVAVGLCVADAAVLRAAAAEQLTLMGGNEAVPAAARAPYSAVDPPDAPVLVAAAPGPPQLPPPEEPQGIVPEEGMPVEATGEPLPEPEPRKQAPEFIVARRIESTYYVALRDASAYLGAQIGWEPAEQRAQTISAVGLVEFWPDRATYLKNERELAARCPPKLLNGVFYVSLRDFAEAYETPLSFAEGGRPQLAIGGQQVPVRDEAELYEIEIDRTRRRLVLHYLDRVVHDFPICVGRGSNTPLGRFKIANKARYPSWRHLDTGRLVPPGPRNPLGVRWMGTTAVGDRGHVIGIHGTNTPSSIGRAISRGCIRMYNRDAIQVYDLIQVGTPVWIH